MILGSCLLFAGCGSDEAGEQGDVTPPGELGNATRPTTDDGGGAELEAAEE